MDTPTALRMVGQVRDYATELERRKSEMELAMLAGEDAFLLGKPIQIEIRWLAGLPDGFGSVGEIQEWARRRLEELRSSDD